MRFISSRSCFSKSAMENDDSSLGLANFPPLTALLALMEDKEKILELLVVKSMLLLETLKLENGEIYLGENKMGVKIFQTVRYSSTNLNRSMVIYLLAGLGGGFLTFSLTAFMVPAWIMFCLSNKYFGHPSLKSTMSYAIPLIPCLAYCVYFGGFLIQFVTENMGMMGSLPSPYGYFVPDIVVAVLVGLVTRWCVGPLIHAVGFRKKKRSYLKKITGFEFSPGSSSEVLITSTDSRI